MFSKELEDPQKILIIGNSSVGKSCIMVKQTKDLFSEKSQSTHGHDFSKQELIFNETKITLMIWDTAGQEQYRPIIKQYYKGAKAVFLVCAMDDDSSVSDLKYWNKEIDKGADNKDMPRIVLGNKYDIMEDQEEKIKEVENKIKEFCEEKNMNYYLTSAKTGKNIKEAFEDISLKILGMNQENLTVIQNSSSKDSKDKSKKNKKDEVVKLKKGNKKKKKQGQADGCC